MDNLNNIKIPIGDKGIPGERDDMFNPQCTDPVERYKHLQRYYFATKRCKGKILDLGCGTGYGCKILFKKGNEVYGVDVSQKAIEYAKNRYPGPHYVCCSAEKLPFKDEFFDGVVSFEVIEHVQNPEIVLKEIYRVLKKKGDLFISTPNPRHLKNVLLHCFFRKPYPSKVNENNIYHQKEFYYDEFICFLKNNGFKIVSKYGQYLPLFPWPISGILNKISPKILIYLGYFFPKYAHTIVVHAKK